MSAPDDSTLTPEAVRKALAESRRSKMSTGSLVERAAAAFDQTRHLGERNGFTEGVRALLRGAA